MYIPLDVQGKVEVEQPTAQLRFVDGKLEQLWVNRITGAEAWKAVPSLKTEKHHHG